MLQPILQMLNAQRIILASSSARRQQILEQIGLSFKIQPSDWEENLNKDDYKTPQEYALATAKVKGLDVAGKFKDSEGGPNLIISADTVVACDGIIYGKPLNEGDAFRMLTNLNGKKHVVYTGVVLIRPRLNTASSEMTSVDFDVTEFYEATNVSISTLSPSVIKSYIATGEPMDKAGAYGIQGIGGSLVESIHGDFYNVMGFPLNRFCKELVALYEKPTA